MSNESVERLPDRKEWRKQHKEFRERAVRLRLEYGLNARQIAVQMGTSYEKVRGALAYARHLERKGKK